MSYQRGYQVHAIYSLLLNSETESKVPAIEISNERNRSAPLPQEISSEGIGKRTFGQYEYQQTY